MSTPKALLPHQIEDAQFLASKKFAGCFSGMGCISGDAMVRVAKGRTKKAVMRVSLRELHRMQHSTRRQYPLTTPSLVDGVILVHNIIKDVMGRGVQSVVKISLANGKSVVCTLDHKIAQPKGWSEAGALFPGAEVYTNGVSPGFIDKDGYVRVRAPGHPRAWKKQQVYQHILVAEGSLGRPIGVDEHVHHVNGIRHDNRPENLEVMPAVDHRRHHADDCAFHGKADRWGNTIYKYPEVTTVVSVEPAGQIDVYDIEMDTPGPSFVADGVVVHNSGKTLTALEAVNDVCAPHERAIIVGPPISLHMWKEEFEAWVGGKAQIVKTGKQEIDAHKNLALIMSYDIATKRKDELKALGAKVLICDESHALKSVTAKRTQAILGKDGLCESVEYAWMLTGTPVTRWNDDIFSFMCRADADALKEKIGRLDMKRFRLRYCVTQMKKYSQRQRFATEVVVGNRNTEELNALLFDGGMAVRRELKDVWAQMPPLTINRLQVKLDADAELKRMLKDLDKKTMNEIRQDMAKKEESIATIRRLLGGAKVKHAAQEIVDRVEAGVHPILVGAWHIDVIDELHNVLTAKGVRAAKLDGRTPGQLKQTLQQDFNDGELDVLVGQIGAMGVSLNMQGGSHIVCVEEDWSPAVMDQFYARCHRLGQKDHVHVDIFESDTKLDQAVRRISAEKTRGHNTLMDQGGSLS